MTGVTMPHLRRDAEEEKKLLLHSPSSSLHPPLCSSVRLSASGSDKLMQIFPERVEIKVSQLSRGMIRVGVESEEMKR